jgi:hypothetical protein
MDLQKWDVVAWLRWRPLVNVKFGNEDKSWTYLCNKYKVLTTSQQNMGHFWGLLQLTERHCECCRLHRVQLTDEAIEAKRNGKDLDWRGRGLIEVIIPKLQKKATRNLRRTAWFIAVFFELGIFPIPLH